MTFTIGLGFAERQILKKWKWPYLINWVEYFDKLLRKHWYWQDLAQEIAKWHFSLVKAEIVKWYLGLVEFLPRFKFWKKWDYCKMTFIIGRGFAERQILIKWKWLYLLNWVEYI